MPAVQTCIETNLQLGRLTNPNIHCVGVSVNTSTIPADKRAAVLSQLQAETGLPCVDPLVEGVETIVQQLLASSC